MKTFEFEQWCDRLQLPTSTRDFLLHLRSSPPARRVQGRLLNVSGTYASRKMGVSIQFESHTVELWAIYTMEYDKEVLEYFDQPCTIELHYRGPSGRPTQARHTPDFLVIRRDGACFEEWKPEEKLLELMVTHPGRYERDDRGTWRCPPGEAAAESLGLSYRVRSSAELHQKLVQLTQRAPTYALILTSAALRHAGAQLKEGYDSKHGGWGTAPARQWRSSPVPPVRSSIAGSSPRS